jgi:hypothetical protein
VSYSFNVSAATKSDAKVAVATKLDEVIAAQAIHARDKVAILANASAVIDLLSDVVPAGHVLSVGCSGYVGWNDVALKEDGSNVADIPFRSVSVSASASYHQPTSW